MKKKNSEIYPVGTKVYKISGNLFKSGAKIATITGVVINEQDPKKRQAYTFEEDDSVVNCELCKDANEHVPTTLMDAQVGDTLHVIADIRNPDSYVKTTVAEIKDLTETRIIVLATENISCPCTFTAYKEQYAHSTYVNHAMGVIIATTKTRLYAAYINECEKSIKHCESTIKEAEDTMSDYYRNMNVARELKKLC